MLDFVQKLAQKPKDSTIRITRVLFALVLIAVILLGWQVTRTEFWLPEWTKYLLFVFPAIGLVRGVIDPGLFRRKIWKWTIFGLGLSMVLISLFAIEDMEPVKQAPEAQVTTSGSLNIADIQNAAPAGTSFTLSTDNWFGFFGTLLMVIGFFLTGKNITTKNERYGEKVTKIRV